MESESTIKSSLEYIDFGKLRHGQGATVKISISGPAGGISFPTSHLIVSPTRFTGEDNEIEITLFNGASGELIWDELTLKNDFEEVKIPVTARWEITEQDDVIVSSTADTMPMTKETVGRLSKPDNRTFKGRSCSRCGKTFSYDEHTMSWERCTCTPYQAMRNMSSYLLKDIRHGFKNLPSYIQELWKILQGKEDGQ